jgi:hypothetical protein
LPSPPRGQALTVFLEPEIESGFPDAVAVYWRVSTAQRWFSERSLLTATDIRVAHFLATMGRSTTNYLCNFFFSGLVKSLERLATAGVVRRSGQYWLLRPLHCVYAVTRLVAIEAKMSDWRGGLVQAVQNRWFASESYLLLSEAPKQSCRSGIKELGVGILERESTLATISGPADHDALPRSYASWLFNEWTWRAAFAT